MSVPARGREGERGIVLTVVIIVTIMMMTLAVAILGLAVNQTKLANGLVSSNVRAQYRAEAGLVDARWRMRANFTTDIGGGDFTSAVFDPPAYYIDIDTNTVHTAKTDADDVEVNISAVGADQPGVRTVDSLGYQ